MSERVVIAAFDTLAKAGMARTLLAGSGIHAVIDNEYQAGLGRTYGPVVEITLTVSAQEAAEALEILAANDLAAPALDPVRPAAAACPQCRSRRLGATLGTKLRALLAMLAAVPVTNITYRCKDCGHRWK